MPPPRHLPFSASIVAHTAVTDALDSTGCPARDRQNHRVVLRAARTRGAVPHRGQDDLIDRHAVLANLNPQALAATVRESQQAAVAVHGAPAVVFPAPAGDPAA